MTGPGDNEVIERLIERVAKAVYDTQRVTGPEWWGQSQQAMEGFRAVARAAIGAHTTVLAEAGYVIVPREPTGEMIIEGQKAFAEAILESHIEGVSVRLEHKLAAVEPHHTRAEWRAMIDAALGKDGGSQAHHQTAVGPL